MDKESNLTFEDACFQWASRQFLYEPVDDDYFELSEEDQHKHLVGAVIPGLRTPA